MRRFGLFLGTPLLSAQDTPAPKEPLARDLVHEFVAHAHANLDRVRELLAQEPALLNASWDWGRGDFETGLGAAGHMGRADIANFLLARGARMDLFCAAMLGKVEIVRATLAAFPNLRDSKGPHGIPLELHAQAGLKNGLDLAIHP